MVWREIYPKDGYCRTFQLGNDPEIIHIIKTGFENKYIVVYEDAFEVSLGKTEILTKEELERKYDILFDEVDQFEKIIRLLHESTHDKDIRECLLKVYDFKKKTLKNGK